MGVVTGASAPPTSGTIPARMGKIAERMTQVAVKRWTRLTGRPVAWLFQQDLIVRTGNFHTTSWLGVPIWQNILDLWTIQETISEIHPALVIETGTHRGGSALFYAQLMELLGNGRVLTIDVVNKHQEVKHPRVTFLEGSSTDPKVIQRVRKEASRADGPVMVILDGNHARDHVAEELELYAPFVTSGSLLLSQDGIIDRMWLFRDSRPGPYEANRLFLERHPEFEYDSERNERFGLTHHPLGWLRRRY
jgi:cephalosporin hydroxylase